MQLKSNAVSSSFHCSRYFCLHIYCLTISDLPEGSGTPAVLAAQIEEEIYKEFKNTDNKYKNKIRSRVSNLRDKKNPALRENVLVGSISADRLVKMSPEVRETFGESFCLYDLGQSVVCYGNSSLVKSRSKNDSLVKLYFG